MKRILFLMLSGLLFSIIGWAQVITSNPVFVTKDYNGEIEIIYDATKGTAGLKDYTGTVYAHTGVITNLSTSNSDWKHTPSWGDNSSKYKLTSLGDNKWKLLITPNMTGYYGLTTNEVVNKLAFVFRSGELVGGKYLEGKDTGGTDIFLDVYAAGLNVSFTNPSADKAVTAGTTETIQMSSSVAADLELFINGASVKTATASTSLSHPYSYSSTIDYQLIAKAVAGGITKYDTVNICVPAPVVTQARPAGVKDGINYSADGTQATLVMYAPNKTNVFVIGDFTNWSQKNAFQMKKDGNYWWTTITGLIPGEMYGFQYLVDGTLKISDAYSELILDPWSDKWINEHYSRYPNLPAYPENKTEGIVSILQSNKPAYAWEVPSFTMPNTDNVVIYELLLRDFTVEKSLEAAIGKLDYLKNLGITAIELMPIQEFDGNESWGYNPNHFFAPDKAYGSPEMYKKFIDECHKHGMAVILDMVFNHSTGLHPFAKLYWNSTTNKTASDNPWYNVDAPHQWSVFHDYNHEFSGTREYFKRVLQYWLTEYKVDGFRMDLSKGFTQKSGTESIFDQSRVDILSDYYKTVTDVKPNAMFILEHFVEPEESTLASKGMYIWRNVNNAFSEAAMGWSAGANFNRMNYLPRKWVGYAESHDEERNFYKAKAYGNGVIKTDSIVRINRVPLNIAFTVLTPGPKMIWQFGEMGYDYSLFWDNGVVKEGNDNAKLANKPSAWGYLNLAHRKAAYDKSSKIIKLKKVFPDALTQGNYDMQIGSGDWNAGKRIAMTHADLNMVVLGNFQPSGTITSYPNFQKVGMWYDLLTGEEINVTNTAMGISVNAGDVKIYTDRKINIESGVNKVEKNINATLHPNVTTGKMWISTLGTVKNVSVYNLQGATQRINYNGNEVDAGELSSGVYFMEIITNEGKGIQKFIKK